MNYRTKLLGDEYEITGNFAEASAPVLFDGCLTQYQTADFRHSPEEAMREYLESVITESGDDPEECEEEIEEAIAGIR